MMARSRHRQRGFTVIEVLFAGLILSIAVLGMFSLVSASHGMSREAEELTTAENAAREKLEEIKEFARNDFYAVRGAYDGAPGEFDVPALKPEPGTAGAIGRVEVTETRAGDPNLLDVVVTIRWWGVGGTRDLALRTRLSPM